MSIDGPKNWQLDQDDDGIVWLWIDTAGRSTNVLTRETLDELEQIVGGLAQHRPRGLIFGSRKPGGFISGADIEEFTRLQEKEEAIELIHRGQSIMDTLESLTCPTVAMIEGYCLGGGLELALACDYRLALDEPKTRLGLPEVKLGIHPGFGGSVRAIRQIGVFKAMELMLTGRTIDARKARRLGLVDQVLPERQLREAARGSVLARPAATPRKLRYRIAELKPARILIARKMRKQVSRKAPPEHYPAPHALIDLWEVHGGETARMYREEARSVAKLITGATAQNLIRVFLLQTRLKGLGDRGSFTPEQVHVIGAGVMGGDIAAWCTLQGMRVTIQDARPEALAYTLKRADKLFSRRFRAYPLLAARAMDRLIPDPEGHGVATADVVIEAIFEDLDAKHALFRDVEPRLKADALLATNTSSIPLDQLSTSLEDPGRLVGLHFFNPVAKMPLLEVVRGADTTDRAMQQALAFTRQIDKLPLPVKSAPGFLVNRVLMPYLLEAIILYSEGVPKEVIDRTARDFGMPMGPVELADTVGLDICLNVGNILGDALGYRVPDILAEMVDKGQLGMRSGSGFYEYKNGQRVRSKAASWDGPLEEIRDRVILRYINEAVACLREGIVEDADLADAAMVFGTGFAPFRGGPLHYRDTEDRQRLVARLEALASQHGERFQPDPGWAS